MKYAFFQGCNIPIRIEQYAQSATAVLAHLGVELVVMPEFNCCGYPMRNVDEKSYILPSVRNMALAERAGLDIMAICNCCFQSLKKARKVLAENKGLQEELNTILAKEGLHYSGKAEVKHLLTVLHTDIGLESIRQKLVNRYTDLAVSVIHGCHLLRPREVTLFDDSFVPKITDDLLQLTGATSLDWPGRMECCGAALAGINDDLANRLLTEKVAGAKVAGAAFIMPICAYCHLQFDTAQVNIADTLPEQLPLPVLLYPQLLGLCLGLSAEQLGIAANNTISSRHIDLLRSLLGPPVEEKKKRRRAAAAAA